MDPVSHAALGRTLIALDRRHRLGRGAAAASIVGSLCPDVDLLRALQGWDVYLRAHQAGTHALAGAVGCGLLTATAVRVSVRGSRWAALAVAATAGALGHVLLDLAAGADIRPWWPLSNLDVTWPLFAMADPWLLGVFAIALAALWRRRSRPIAVTALAIVAAMCGAKAVLFDRAAAIDRRAVPLARARRADAVFGSWAQWTFFHAGDDRVDRWTVDAVRGTAERAFSLDRNLIDTRVRQSLPLPTIVNLRAAHDITLARVRPQRDGGYELMWTDLRYCAAALEGSDPLCGVWVGGEYSAGGQPLAAFARVGNLVQRRPVVAMTDH